MPEDRRLSAIMFTDIVGYTALMGSDEVRVAVKRVEWGNKTRLIINFVALQIAGIIIFIV